MTRQEFLDDVSSFPELIDFCNEEGLDCCYDIYDADSVNEILMGYIGEMREWTDVRALVMDVPSGYDYYREDGYGSFESADDCFDDYKEEVIRYMDSNNRWDEEENEDCEEYEDDDAMENDDMDIGDSSFLAVVGRAV